MTTTDPQFLYMILVLPSLFGLTLVGDGINKLVHEEAGAYVSVIFGIVFIGIVVFIYIFFSSYLTPQG
jgi:hypothetical protein